MKVSVIVPVYKVEKYIEKCARSLFEQSLDDIEFLFVDDCTPDHSIQVVLRILEEYPNRSIQTRIIKMPWNSGQAAVRRHGIIASKGDYIIHCDSDDWTDTDLYERMYNKAIAEDADIVVCDEIWEYLNRSSLVVEPGLSNCPREIVKNWYHYSFGMYCHNKLVRRGLWEEYDDLLPWEGLNMWEDNGLMFRVFYYANKITQIRGSYYHYNKANVSSMTAGYGAKQVGQMIGVAEHLTCFFNSKPDAEKFEKTVMALQFLAKINLLMDKWGDIRCYKLTFPGSERIMPEIDKKAFSWKGRLRFNLVRYHMAWISILIYKIIKLITEEGILKWNRKDNGICK